MTSLNFDATLSSSQVPMSLSSGDHQGNRSMRINFKNDDSIIKFWSGGINDKELNNFPISNRMQSITLQEDNVKCREITSIHTSDSIIHILVNQELKQIISCKPNMTILSHHIYLRKKKKISIVISCSDSNLYLFEILKKEKKRKSKKESNHHHQHFKVPSKFTRISKDKIKSDLDWKDEIVNNHGIIVKELGDGDFLTSVSNIGLVSQIQSVESETLKTLISDEQKRSKSGKHMLLISGDQVHKLYQEEETEDLTIISHTKLPSVASCRIAALYYCEERSNNNTITLDQNSFIVDEEFFKCLFGRDFVFLTSSICMVGCDDGSVFCYPSNHNVIQRFTQTTCNRKITQLRDPVQNIIPMIISIDSSMKKFNSILVVGRFGHVVLLYHDGERVLHRSWYINQQIVSSIIHKEQLIFSNRNGSMFSFNIFSKTSTGENPFSFSKNSRQVVILENIHLREMTSGSVLFIHELKNQKLYQNPNTNLDVSLSQLSFSSERERHPTLSSKPKGYCTVLTRDGLLHQISIQSHENIDDYMSNSSILNRLQTGIRDMIVKLDENQIKLQDLSQKEKELNQEIYSLNVGMHLLHEWKDQGKKLISSIECKVNKENLEISLECTLLNESQYVLTNQWSIIIVLEQEYSPVKSFSYPIIYLESGDIWKKNISLLSFIDNLNLPFKVTFLLTFSHAESQFSLETKRQEFNLLDLIQPSTPQYANMKKNLGFSCLEGPKQRLKSLVNKGLNGNYIPLSNSMSNMTHGFKLRFNPLEEAFANNWQSILQIPLSDDLPKDVLNRVQPIHLSSNNLSTTTSLITPYGQELKLRISSSPHSLHSFDVLLQGSDFHSLLLARYSILAKFRHFLTYRNEILGSEAYPRLSSKEELIELIKAMQNFGDKIQQLTTSLEQLENSSVLQLSYNGDSNSSFAQVLSKIISFDRNIIDLYREMRQTKCGI